MAKKNAKTENDIARPLAMRSKDQHEQFQPSEHLKPMSGDPNQNAYQNGVPCSDYANRILSMQGVGEPATVKIGNVERGLRRQGYPLEDIRAATEIIYQALMG